MCNVLGFAIFCEQNCFLIDCTLPANHSSDSMATDTVNAIELAETTFGVVVIGIVTDNASNMSNLRNIVKGEKLGFYEFGCQVHWLNLFKDVLTTQVAGFFSTTPPMCFLILF